MKPVQLVFAGSLSEAIAYARENTLLIWRCVLNEEDLWGWYGSPTDAYFVGTFWDRLDAQKLYDNYLTRVRS